VLLYAVDEFLRRGVSVEIILDIADSAALRSPDLAGLHLLSSSDGPGRPV
jgi:hypothetical protein